MLAAGTRPGRRTWSFYFSVRGTRLGRNDEHSRCSLASAHWRPGPCRSTTHRRVHRGRATSHSRRIASSGAARSIPMTIVPKRYVGHL